MERKRKKKNKKTLKCLCKLTSESRVFFKVEIKCANVVKKKLLIIFLKKMFKTIIKITSICLCHMVCLKNISSWIYSIGGVP